MLQNKIESSIIPTKAVLGVGGFGKGSIDRRKMPRTTTIECPGCPPLRALSFDVLGLIKVIEAHGKQGGVPKVVERWGEPDSSRCMLAASINDRKIDPLLAVARKGGMIEVCSPINGDVRFTVPNVSDASLRPEDDAVVGLHLFSRQKLELTSRSCTLFTCTTKGNASMRSIEIPDSPEGSASVGSSRTWSVCASGNILCSKVDGSENYALFGGKGVEVNMWDLENCTKIWAAKSPPKNSLDIFSPTWFTSATFMSKDDQRKIVAGTNNHQVRLYDISAQRRPVISFDFRETPIKAIAEDFDGYTVYMGNGSGDLASVDMRTGKLLGCFLGKCSGSIRSIARHPELPVIASCGLDSYIRIWDIKTRQLLSAVFLKQHLTNVVFDSNFADKEFHVSHSYDEIVWLVRSVEVMVDVGTSEVFWDQSRASYPRLLVQQCHNRHGRYLILEERDGRRRCGIILIPEGWHGHGWARIISELRRAKGLLIGENVGRGSKVAKVIPGRSFAEAVKESVAPATSGGGYRQVSAMTQNQRVPATDTAASAGSSSLLGNQAGVLAGALATNGRAQASKVPATHEVGAVYTGIQEKLMRQQEVAFNVKEELAQCREWLRRVRGEVDAGIGRIDVAILKLESFGPDQGSMCSGWAAKPTKRSKHFIIKGFGPDTSKDKLKAKIMDDGEGPSHGLNTKKRGPVGAGDGSALGPDFLKPGPIGADPVIVNPGGPSSCSHQKTPRETYVDQEEASPVAVGMASEGVPGKSGAPVMVAEEAGRRFTTSIGFMSPKFQRERSTVSANVLKMPEGRLAGSGLVTQPSSSWVAGKTGFGTIVPEMGTGTSLPAGDSKEGVDTLATAAVSQANTQVFLVELGEGAPSVPNSMGLSLSDSGAPVGAGKVAGEDSTKLCACSDSGGQEEMVSENGMEVSFVEDSVAESGNESRLRGLLGDSSPVVIPKRKAGVLIEERADSPIGGRLDLAEEVGGIIGLTCDGQEGLKRECFKKIIVDNIGRGEGSLGAIAQQEAENIQRERGNCSDYEA